MWKSLNGILTTKLVHYIHFNNKTANEVFCMILEETAKNIFHSSNSISPSGNNTTASNNNTNNSNQNNNNNSNDNGTNNTNSTSSSNTTSPLRSNNNKSFFEVGRNITLDKAIQFSKIVQCWRSAQWPNNHFSLVNFLLEKEEYGIRVTCLSERVPISKIHHMELMLDNFWKQLGGVVVVDLYQEVVL